MRIVRAGEGRSLPWKNGGGWTTEIAVDPDQASLDTFVWRLSMARVTQDGPFSSLPGVDRSLAILDGAGLRLTVAGDEHIVEPARSLWFPADVPTTAVLLDGPVTDLNLMTRRSNSQHRMRLASVNGTFDFAAEHGTLLIYGVAGRLALDDDAVLDRGDCAILGPSSHRLAGTGKVLLIEITQVEAAAGLDVAGESDGDRHPARR